MPKTTHARLDLVEAERNALKQLFKGRSLVFKNELKDPDQRSHEHYRKAGREGRNDDRSAVDATAVAVTPQTAGNAAKNIAEPGDGGW